MQHLLVLVLVLVVTPICSAVYNGTFTSRSSATPEERVHLTKLLLERSNNTNQYIKTIDKSANIIGGNPANDNEYPWFGLTVFTVFSPSGIDVLGPLICGGSLIYSDIVMTAAHCIVDLLIENPGYSFIADFYLGANNIDGSDGTKYSVATLVTPKYDYATGANDIAFYKLSTSTNVNPVSWNSNSSIPVVGQNGTAIGFGDISDTGNQTTKLMKVNLPAISVAECENFYADDLPDSITCTYTPGKSTCVGDSGGPIITQNGVVYGVVSFGADPCSQGPTGFTRTSNFTDFIPKVICDYSSSPVLPCTGFEVDDGCGLLGFSIFCPCTFGGIFGRLLRALFGN